MVRDQPQSSTRHVSSRVSACKVPTRMLRPAAIIERLTHMHVLCKTLDGICMELRCFVRLEMIVMAGELFKAAHWCWKGQT